MTIKPPDGVPFGLVIWDDHCQFENPVTVADVHGKHRPETMHTIGWILKEDATGVTIANEFYDGSFRGTSFIDRRMIQSVTHMRLVKERKPKVKMNPSDLEGR